MDHVTIAEIGSLAAGCLKRAERRRVFRHLLSQCPVCLPLAAPFATALGGREAPDLPEAELAVYDAALDKAFAAVRERQRQREKAWCDRFLAKVRERKLTGFDAIVDAMDPRMPGRAKIEALLTLSFEARHRDPQEMRDLAAGAMASAASLNMGRAQRVLASPAEVADIRGRVWTELANAYRRCDTFSDSERALSTALGFLAQGTRDPLLRARLLDVTASLRIDQRQLEEAIAYLDRAYEIYIKEGDTHRAGRALIKKGIAIHCDERPREAVPVLREGLAMLDAARDPQLLAHGQESLLHALTDAGSYNEASRFLLQSGLRQALAGEPLNVLKLRWVEAKIFAGQGKLRRAESVLLDVEDGFVAAGLAYEVGLVSLERVEVLLRQGRAEEVVPVVEKALKTFEALKIGREALRAMSFLREACEQEAATTALVRRVIDFLQQLRSKPYLRFALQ